VRGKAPLKKRPQSLKGSAVGGSIPSLATIICQSLTPMSFLLYSALESKWSLKLKILSSGIHGIVVF